MRYIHSIPLQVSESHHIAIFSMWNEGTKSVNLIEAGSGVQVSKFGNEGTGLKSIKDIGWVKDQQVTFKV